MIKKVYISESEKEKILSLHKLLNEGDSKFKISGVVINKEKKDEILIGADVVLYSGETLLNRKKTDANGFTFDDLIRGEYIIKSSAIIEGFQEKSFDVEVKNKDVQVTIELDKTRELQEVKLLFIPLTSLSFNFTDTEGKKVDNVKIQLYRDPTTLFKILPKMETTDGGLNIFIDNYDTVVKKDMTYDVKNSASEGFFNTKGKKVCEDFKNLYVVAKTTNFISQKTKIEFCLNNAVAKGSSEPLIDNKTNEEIGTKLNITYEPEKQEGLGNSNTFEIKFSKPTISGTFKVLNDSDVLVPNSVINLYSDSSKSKLVKKLVTNNQGSVTETFTASDFELLDDDEDVVSKIILYAEITQTGYQPYFERVKLRYDKTNEIDFKLKSIKPPKEPRPPKPMRFGPCRRVIKKYYYSVDKIQKGKMALSELGDEIAIIEQREQVEKCYIDFINRYSKNVNTMIKRLRNVMPKYNVLELTFPIETQRDIYKENYSMSINHSIRKVISEHSENKKSLIAEKKIIENRLFFILENSDIKNYRKNLIREGNNLLRKGYNKKFIRESFMDIMANMKDNAQDFLMDVKNQLGQKIADTVKDKQQEHEMILGAFNELDPEVIERAFKENKVDELSQIIAEKALENYKNQFGEGSIFGSMIASVDINKFKQEVSKLLQTAVDQINTEMADKVKDAVSDKETE